MMWEKGAFTVSGGTGPWQQRSDQTSLRRMGMRRKMSRTACIDDKQICLSCETCIFITFVHRVQILHNVWVRRLVHYALCTKHFVQCTFHYALCTWCTLYKTLMHLCANWHLCERRWASSRNVIMNTTARIRIIMNTARIWVQVNTSGTNSYQTSGYILYACEHINQVCTVRINQILIKPQFYGQDMYVGTWSTSLVLPFLLLSYTHTHTNMF